MVLSLLGAGFPEPCGLHGSGKGIPRLYGGKRPAQNGKHTPGPRHGAHPVMTELRMRNGEEFDYSTLYNRPSRTSELISFV